MISPGKYDLIVYRWTPYVFQIRFEGFDFTAASMAMQVRVYPDAVGSPLLSLVNAASNAEGLSVVVTTEDIEYGGVIVPNMPVSTVQIRINETTIEALLPFPSNGTRPDEKVKLAYDLHITGGGLAKTRWLEGQFYIDPGVTQ